MSQQVIVTGAEGLLGRAVVRALARKQMDVVALNHRECDIADAASVQDLNLLGRRTEMRPLIINCAGVVPDIAFKGDPLRLKADMWRTNAHGPSRLAVLAGRLVHVSTDCVFDGAIREGAYDELAKPSPSGPYAESKMAGEVTQAPHLTVRGSFIGLGRRGLMRWILDQPQEAHIPGYQDWVWNGAYVGDFADALVELAIDPSVTGLVHLAGSRIVAKGELVRWLAAVLRPDLVVVQGYESHRRMVLASTRIDPITTPWRVMLERLRDDYRQVGGAA